MKYIIIFFNDTATTEIYTLSLHDALPIFQNLFREVGQAHHQAYIETDGADPEWPIWYASFLQERLGSLINASDRKSTRLNSSHANISYAVFCLKKKKITHIYRLHSSI